MQSIRNVKNLTGKSVLVRVDFNVPLEGGKVVEDSRLLASLPTIEFLIGAGAKVILLTHVGRPKGKVVDELKTDPIAARLSEILKRSVIKLLYRRYSPRQQVASFPLSLVDV